LRWTYRDGLRDQFEKADELGMLPAGEARAAILRKGVVDQ
jgi:hypothetical protein